jgi:hypothetical protein
MCWSKTPQRAKPERCFTEAKPPKGGAAFTVCYVPFAPPLRSFNVNYTQKIKNQKSKKQAKACFYPYFQLKKDPQNPPFSLDKNPPKKIKYT